MAFTSGYPGDYVNLDRFQLQKAGQVRPDLVNVTPTRRPLRHRHQRATPTPTQLADFDADANTPTATPTPTVGVRSALIVWRRRCPSANFGGVIEGGHVVGLGNGDWLEYGSVDFGSGGLSQIQSLVSGGSSGSGLVSYRVDSPAGPLLGNFAVGNTGGWNSIGRFLRTHLVLPAFISCMWRSRRAIRVTM